jgi:hypothetical protein
MAQTPDPKSYETILGEMLASYMAKIGINDLSTASAVTSFFETMAQAVFRAQGDAFSILRDNDVDRATGEALKKIASAENIKLEPARVATGKVVISDSSFSKIATKVYAGATAPNVGSTVIKVSDASLFSATGSIYIGRGTPNSEGPLAYTSITQVGGYWEINLTVATTKFHNISESIILAQGGVRNIPAGTVIKSPTAGGAPDVNYKTTSNSIILDGENRITGVAVAAESPGTDSNVPRNSIKAFGSLPFTGATVFNDQPLSTGRNAETDEEIRTKIKRARISKGLGTALAIKNSTLGIQATDENSRVASNEIFSDTDSAILYIDNGEGYEQKNKGVGLEYIVGSAIGGEERFQLATGGGQTSVTKAYLESSIDSPFSIQPNDRVAILVGSVLSEHTFIEGDFRSNGFATAYEVASSINANPNLTFVARTSNTGKRVTLEAKSEDNEYLKVTDTTTGGNAGTAMGLTSSEVQTLRLYKNRTPLSRNGKKALLESATQSEWSNTISTGDTLIISVDETDFITYSFTNSDFIAEGTYPSISKSNSLQSWINVINAKVTGVTASINGSRVVLTSNLGVSSRASLQIDSASTLVTKGVFNSILGLSSVGAESDFILSRNTAQFKLSSPLSAGDSLTAGTEFSNASISSGKILGGTVTFATDAYLWFLIDNQTAEFIPTGVVSDTLVSVTKPSTNIVRFASNVATAFTNVEVGDYVIIWSEELNANNRIEGRVNAKTSSTFDLRITPIEFAGIVPQVLVSFSEGMVFLRTTQPPQKIKFSAGAYDINTISNSIQNNLVGVTSSTLDDEVILITSKSVDLYGSVLSVTFNDSAKNLNLIEGDLGTSIDSHFAFYESARADGDFPLFVHSSITNNKQSDPPNSLITDFGSAINLASQGIAPNELIGYLHPYLTSGIQVEDAQADGEFSQIESLSGLTVNIEASQFIKRLRQADRYYVASTFNFGASDTLTLVLDEDPTNKTFPIPLYRRAIVNTTMPINSNDFRAYDVDSGASSEFQTFFGSAYDFSNYKALMKAKNVIDPNSGANEDAILFRSSLWGASGEKFNVGYAYPTASNLPVSHVTVVGNEVDIYIALKSGAPVVNQINGTTEWDVTITPNTPVVGVDEVSYTWSGTGSNPTMTSLAAGNYVTINSNGEFSYGNQGTFKVSSATSTSFTVHRPSGVAVTESNVANLTLSTVLLYQNSATTAQEIVDYVTTNLSDFITATVLDDAGLTGAGVITSSTYEDSDFTQKSVSLVDGINYVEFSTLPASAPFAQFGFKNTLQLASFSTNTVNAYSFNNGEEVRFIPTTAKQIDELISTLAVSGATTLSEINTSSRGGKLQISTNILGSSGAVQITGGTANSAVAKIINQAIPVLGTDLMKASILRSASAGFQVGQLVRISAESVQKKDSGVSFTSNVTVHPNTIVAGKTVVEMGNKDDYDRYFGQPRNAVRDLGRAFHVEKHGKLVCISWDGQTGSNPLFTKSVLVSSNTGNISVDFNGSLGLTSYTSTSGSRNFSEAQVGDKFTISSLIEASNNGTFNVVGTSLDKKTIVVANIAGVDAVSQPVLPANLLITTKLQEGDTVEIGAPFASLNQGKFRIIKQFNDSFYVDNQVAVEERVVVSESLRALGFDATTQFDVTVPGNMRLTWNGTGTQPSLQNAKLGDILTLGTAFAPSSNQGSFMITKSNRAMKESFTITAPSAADIQGGERIHFDLPNLGTAFYGWFDLNNTSVDPTPVARTSVQFDYTGSEPASSMAVIIQLALTALSGVTATVLGNTVTVEFDNYGPCIDAENIDVESCEVVVIQQGSLAYVECANSTATAESNISVTGIGANVLKAHKPSMIISPYDNTNIGDSLIISGNVLTSSNKGTYVITEVLDESRVVVDEILAIQNSVALASNFTQVYIEEEKPYVGYKNIHNLIVDPANSNRYLMIFDSNHQFSKINDVAISTINGLGKLGFSEINRKGLDSYRYDTGLIAQANKVIYGDPRDNVTYPGVAAAGAEIFVKPPLFKRIKVSINVRVRTGIPFTRVVEQVRNNVAALVNSTGIGQPIAISDIVSVVNSIPGVSAVAISSPAYDVSNDVIAVAPTEKALIIDIVNDIIVAKTE